MIEHRYPEFFPVAPLPLGAELVAALDFRRLPKVLLHEHLDGGLRPASIIELADDQGYEGLPTSDPGDLAEWFHRGAQRGNLPEYLEGFAHTIAVMQTRDALARVACEFLEDMAKDGVVYAEVRFAPVFHTGGGLMSDTEMSKELEIAATTFNLSLVEIEKMTMDAMKSAFAPHQARVDLIQRRLLPNYAMLFAELTAQSFANQLPRTR
jgi:adenosine deaminase